MLIANEQFSAALIAAQSMSDQELRAAAQSGVSRSYYVVVGDRTFPLKAVLRLAYKREGLKWDKPQSSKAARQLRAKFDILHIKKATEAQRLERQRQNVERWSRDGRFRTDVLDLYRSRCVVTGCSSLDAIDAAHLLGVGNKGDDKAENGIVFRADIHRLFDAEPAQMSIDPATMTVHFSHECRKHYAAYAGRIIELPDGGPTPKSFKAHWQKFQATRAKRDHLQAADVHMAL